MRTAATKLSIASIAIGFLSLTLVAPVAAEDGRGEALFQLCVQCHGASGEGRASLEAPAIAGLPEWYVTRQLTNFQGGARGKHFDDLQGMRMRPMALSLREGSDVQAVSAYVASLPTVQPTATLEGGNAASGEGAYLLCATCHGADGKGVEAQGGPPLVGQSDWYLLSSIKKFQAGIRGTNAGDTYGQLMRPMSMTLPNEQAIKDVVAYILTLSGDSE